MPERDTLRDCVIEYRAEPTPARFHASGALVRGLMGPVGSGKSVACCVELLARALRQEPHDGVRRTRFAVVRNTYPELRSTTLRTWSEWVPEDLCPVTLGSPIVARMRIPDIGDGTALDTELLFLALDRPEDTKKLLSLELTGAWVNEAREVAKAALDMLTGRVGRYPGLRLGGPTWSGIIMDTNPPDDDHWWYRLAEEDRPQGYEFFRQPAALMEQNGVFIPNPLAENAGNQPLGHDYWLRQCAGKSRDWIEVYILGRYGAVQEGRPVYPEYDDALHCAGEPLSPLPGVPLVLGFDFGLTPACVVCQEGPRGELRVIDELASVDMGIRQFIREAVQPRLSGVYRGYRVESVGDPAGSQRSQTNERTCLEELREAGIPTDPAPTNDFIARREAVAGFLTGRRDEKPLLLLSPRCKALRKGFRGKYRLERIPIIGEERYRDTPEKNMASHVHDALQYAALTVERRQRLGTARARAVGRRRNAMGWT